MSKAEQFIKDCTRNCSNLVVSLDSGIVCSYAPWLTPDQALRAVEIEREELIDTIEVKVDLEKEIDDAFLENKCNITDNVSLAEFARIAKHFYELGLKAKGE